MEGRPVHVLVVDDNPANLKLLRVALETEGYETTSAVDADDAIRALQLRRPDLILMDVQLPGMDGLDLSRRLKADPTTHGIVIVAVTAYAMKGDRQKALDAGCDGYLTKPIDVLSLPRDIDHFLSGSARNEAHLS
jgi:CheY-like chemotaxis protein